MAALLGYFITLAISVVVLLLDFLTGGWFGRLLLSIVPEPLRSRGIVITTILSISILYAVLVGVIRQLRRAAQRLAKAGQPPLWADNLLAFDARLRQDTSGWAGGLAGVIGVIAVPSMLGVIAGVVAPEIWTLFVLAGVTLIWHFIERQRALPRGSAPRREPPAREHERLPPTPEEVLAKLRGWDRYRGQLRAVRTLPPRPGKYARFGERDAGATNQDWAAALRSGGLLYSAMRALGIASPDRLYAHQAYVLEAVLAKPPTDRPLPHMVLATAPGSGRATTIFLATLEQTLQRGEHVLVVASDEAMLERQRTRFHDLAKETDWRYALYDGIVKSGWQGGVPDPPPEVLFCTLESLHGVLLADHAAWEEFWADLALVVTPEISRYTGIFGANAVQVFRRLRLVSRRYGRAIQFLATAHPADDLEPFARTLWSCAPNEEVRCEQNDSSPRPAGALGVWMPPLDRVTALGARPSRHLERQRTANAIVELGIFLAHEPNYRFIVYCPDLDTVAAQGLRDRIVAASGGYLDQQECLVTTVEVDTTEYAEDYDALVIMGTPQRLDEAMRLAGRIGARRNGGVVLVLAPPSAAIIRMVRALGASDDATNAPSMPSEQLVVLPLDGQHPAVIRKHLACALAETPLTGTDVAAMWGQVGKAQLATLRRTGVLVDRANAADREVRWMTPPDETLPHTICPLDTVGADPDTVVVSFSTDGTVAMRVDTHRAASVLYPGRRLIHNGTPWILASTESGYEARPPAMEDRATAVPLYEVAAESPDGASPAVVSHIGDGTPIGVRRGPLTITQTLVATRMLPADAPSEHAIVAPVPRRASTTFTTETLMFTGMAGTPMGEPEAYALAHLFHVILHAMLPAIAWNDEAMVAAVARVRGMEECGAAVLVYETIADGQALVATLYGRWQQLLREAYRTALTCPCQDGCPACLADPYDRVYTIREIANKRAVLYFLGTTLGSQALVMAGRKPDQLDALRYAYVSDIDDLISIATDVQRFGLHPLLGLDASYISAPVRFMNANETKQEGVLGFFGRRDNGDRFVAVNLKSEEELVGVLAHEYAHDWQYRDGRDDTPNMHPSLEDPDIVPYGGRLLVEGFAQWMELRVLDGYGFKRNVDNIQFRVFDEYGEGYHIIKMIEDRAGVAGVLARLHTEITLPEVQRLIHEAGTASRVKDLIAQIEAGAIRLPPSDVVIEAPSPPPESPPSAGPSPETGTEPETEAAAPAEEPAESATEPEPAEESAATEPEVIASDGPPDDRRVARALLFGFHFGFLRYGERNGKRTRSIVEWTNDLGTPAWKPLAGGMAAAFAKMKGEPSTLVQLEQAVLRVWDQIGPDQSEAELRAACQWAKEEMRQARTANTHGSERQHVLAHMIAAVEEMEQTKV